MVIRPWLPQVDPIWTIANDLVAINLFWGLLNLLPLGGLDGGNVVTNLFVLAMGERGRRPGMILVAIASLVIAALAAVVGFVVATPVSRLWSTRTSKWSSRSRWAGEDT